MSETIITKTCTKCKIKKPLSEFYKHHGCKDGHINACKCCIFKRDKKYRQTEQGKTSQRKYHQSEKCKATKKRYAHSERGKAVQIASIKRCSQSEKRKAAKQQYQQSKRGKAAHQKALLRHKKQNPEEHTAKNAVNNAIRDGKLPRVNTLKCSCGQTAKHYHHWKDYTPEHWFDIIPVCCKCHVTLHRNVIGSMSP